MRTQSPRPHMHVHAWVMCVWVVVGWEGLASSAQHHQGDGPTSSLGRVSHGPVSREQYALEAKVEGEGAAAAGGFSREGSVGRSVGRFVC